MSLAPGDAETLRQLTNTEARPLAPAEGDELPEDLTNFRPTEEVLLDKKLLLQTLRGLRKELSGNLSGMRNKHLKILLPVMALYYTILYSTLLYSTLESLITLILVLN